MTNAAQCLTADIAARLHCIESTMQEANQTLLGDDEANATGGEVRLRLSHRTQSLKDRLVRCRASLTVEDVAKKLDTLNATLHPLLPSYISHECPTEPVEDIDDAVAEQHYAVLLRELQTLGGRRTGMEDLQRMKANMQTLTSSSTSLSTNATIANILSYDLGPQMQAVPEQDKEAIAALGPQGSYDLAVANTDRSERLLSRIAALKARYTRLVDYTNRQLCMWDLTIEEKTRRAKAPAPPATLKGVTTSM